MDKTSLQISVTEFDENNFIFIPNNRNLFIFELLSGDIQKILKGHFDSINCCLYNTNANEIYSGSKDKNLLIWSPKYTNDDCSKEKDLFQNTKKRSHNATFNSTSRRINCNSWSDNESE